AYAGHDAGGHFLADGDKLLTEWCLGNERGGDHRQCRSADSPEGTAEHRLGVGLVVLHKSASNNRPGACPRPTMWVPRLTLVSRPRSPGPYRSGRLAGRLRRAREATRTSADNLGSLRV